MCVAYKWPYGGREVNLSKNVKLVFYVTLGILCDITPVMGVAIIQFL